MTKLINPGDPSGCADTTQLTIMFENGYRVCVEDVTKVNQAICDILHTEDYNKCPIPDRGIFAVVDMKTKTVMQIPTIYAKLEGGHIGYRAVPELVVGLFNSNKETEV